MLDRDALLHDIRSLMHTPAEGEPDSLRERIERTLTDGYAHALALEGERLQLERELTAVADRVGRGETAGLVSRLAELSTRLRSTDTNLAELRTLLASLRGRAAEVRAA
jgi:ABC-type phosphate transport system auxiliary subunit